MVAHNSAHRPNRTSGVPPAVECLTYLEIPRAVQTTRDAMRNDPMGRYIRDADTVPGSECRGRVYHFVNYIDQIIHHRAWTIDHGQAVLTLRLPGDSEGPFLPFIKPLLEAANTKELTKRRTEIREKIANMLRSAFGDRVDSLIELHGLVTAPESQGHGYGTALMHFANALADAQGRGVYIFTTEAYTFYETVGYTVVEEDVLGKDNPKWAGDPVHIRIMYRGPERSPGRYS